jgi:Ulp1 protease family, C-terminal catalytic domain
VSENSYDAVRIAVNGTMYTSECSVSLKDDSVLWLSCQEVEPARKTRSTRNTNNRTRRSSGYDLNRDDAVQELKYFLVDDTDGAIDVDGDDDAFDQDHLSFLFLKLNKACAVPDKPSSPGTHDILIEFRSDSDITELLKVVGGVGSMAAFTNDGAKLNVAQAKNYGKVLLEHSQTETARRSTIGKADKNSKFLQDKDENDILLVYPIAGGDPVEIDAAADGLNELRGPTGGGDDDGVVPSAPGAADAAATSLETSGSDDGTSDATWSAAAQVTAPTALKTGRTHNVAIQVGDYMRLEPEEYLNDSLIDFWMRWIMRKGDNSMMHIFSTHFYTSLVEKGIDGVTNWTAKKNINIFEKKLLFIPINKSLHWSMVVVVNPLHIVTMEKPEEAKDGSPASFILFLDSLKAHQISVIAKSIRTWLNSEWKRLKKNLEFNRDDPFNYKTLAVHNPTSTCRGSMSRKNWTLSLLNFLLLYTHTLRLTVAVFVFASLLS